MSIGFSFNANPQCDGDIYVNIMDLIVYSVAI